MITKMHITNFKCFKDLQVDLGPFTVLIGPNGSGKSSFLLAVGAAAENARVSNKASRKSDAGFAAWELWDAISGHEYRFDFEVPCKLARADKVQISVVNSEHGFESRARAFSLISQKWFPLPLQGQDVIARSMNPVHGLDLSPSALKEPSELTEKVSMSSGGKGLPSLLNAIFGQDRDAFLKLEDAFCESFPEYKRILFAPQHLSKEGRVGQTLVFKTANGHDLPASAVSDGTIRYLAYLALKFIPVPPRILLVEEPENGVHYGRLKEIIEVLRRFQAEKSAQVILTTHSPFLLDLVEPDEVLVFSKDAEGAAHARKLSDWPDVDDMKKHFMTGEIWTILGKTEGI